MIGVADERQVERLRRQPCPGLRIHHAGHVGLALCAADPGNVMDERRRDVHRIDLAGCSDPRCEKPGEQACSGADVRHHHTRFHAGCRDNVMAPVVDLATVAFEARDPDIKLGVQEHAVDVRTRLPWLRVRPVSCRSP